MSSFRGAAAHRYACRSSTWSHGGGGGAGKVRLTKYCKDANANHVQRHYNSSTAELSCFGKKKALIRCAQKPQKHPQQQATLSARRLFASCYKQQGSAFNAATVCIWTWHSSNGAVSQALFRHNTSESSAAPLFGRSCAAACLHNPPVTPAWSKTPCRSKGKLLPIPLLCVPKCKKKTTMLPLSFLLAFWYAMCVDCKRFRTRRMSPCPNRITASTPSGVIVTL